MVLLFIAQPAISASSAPSIISFATSDEPPANFLNNGKLEGMSVDIVEEMIALSGRFHEISFYPWARAYDKMQKEANFFLFTGGKIKERIDQGIQFIGPLTTRNHLLLQLKSSAGKKVNSINDLKGARIAGVNGDWRTAFFTSKGVDVYQVTTPSLLYQMLKYKRVDYIITSDFEINANAAAEGLSVDDLSYGWIFQTASGYLMTSKLTDSKLVKQWQNLYRQVVKNGKMKKRAQFWTKKYGTDFRFSAQKGFYIAKPR